MFKNANEFSIHVENLARESGNTYIDTILEYCEKNEIDPKEISAMINQNLKEKLEMEYEELNYLPKKSRLM